MSRVQLDSVSKKGFGAGKNIGYLLFRTFNIEEWSVSIFVG